jgi:phage shock protein E
MENTVTLIDVRTPEEFRSANVPDSINIPLGQLADRITDLRGMAGNLIFFCASGNRSGQAVLFLKNQGFTNVENGGSWVDMLNFSKR